MVRIKAKEYTLDFVLDKKESHSKMDNLKYIEIKLQQYLRDTKISVAEEKNSVLVSDQVGQI